MSTTAWDLRIHTLQQWKTLSKLCTGCFARQRQRCMSTSNGSLLAGLPGLVVPNSHLCPSNSGMCSGANLAAVVTHKAALAEPRILLLFQLLIVPVVDNTASVEDHRYASWYENRNTAMLTPERMLWFRRNYLPHDEDLTKWESSPVFAPSESFKHVPDAWIAVSDLDILRDEGIAYGDLIERAGHKVEIKLYKGAPHARCDGRRRAYYTGRRTTQRRVEGSL